MTRQMVVVWMTVLSLGVLADVATPKSRVSESVGADLVLMAKGEVVSVRGGTVDQVSAGKADDGKNDTTSPRLKSNRRIPNGISSSGGAHS